MEGIHAHPLIVWKQKVQNIIDEIRISKDELKHQLAAATKKQTASKRRQQRSITGAASALWSPWPGGGVARPQVIDMAQEALGQHWPRKNISRHRMDYLQYGPMGISAKQGSQWEGSEVWMVLALEHLQRLRLSLGFCCLQACVELRDWRKHLATAFQAQQRGRLLRVVWSRLVKTWQDGQGSRTVEEMENFSEVWRCQQAFKRWHGWARTQCLFHESLRKGQRFHSARCKSQAMHTLLLQEIQGLLQWSALEAGKQWWVGRRVIGAIKIWHWKVKQAQALQSWALSANNPGKGNCIPSQAACDNDLRHSRRQFLASIQSTLRNQRIKQGRKIIKVLPPTKLQKAGIKLKGANKRRLTSAHPNCQERLTTQLKEQELISSLFKALNAQPFHSNSTRPKKSMTFRQRSPGLRLFQKAQALAQASFHSKSTVSATLLTGYLLRNLRHILKAWCRWSRFQQVKRWADHRFLFYQMKAKTQCFQKIRAFNHHQQELVQKFHVQQMEFRIRKIFSHWREYFIDDVQLMHDFAISWHRRNSLVATYLKLKSSWQKARLARHQCACWRLRRGFLKIKKYHRRNAQYNKLVILMRSRQVPRRLFFYFSQWKEAYQKFLALQRAFHLAQQCHDHWELRSITHNQFNYLVNLFHCWREITEKALQQKHEREQNMQADIMYVYSLIQKYFSGWKTHAILMRSLRSVIFNRREKLKKGLFIAWKEHFEGKKRISELFWRDQLLYKVFISWWSFKMKKVCRSLHKSVRHWAEWVRTRLLLKTLCRVKLKTMFQNGWLKLSDRSDIFKAENHWSRYKKKATLNHLRCQTRSWLKQQVFEKLSHQLSQRLRANNEALLKNMTHWTPLMTPPAKQSSIIRITSKRDIGLKTLVLAQWKTYVQNRWQQKLLSRKMDWMRNAKLLHKAFTAWIKITKALRCPFNSNFR